MGAFFCCGSPFGIDSLFFDWKDFFVSLVFFCVLFLGCFKGFVCYPARVAFLVGRVDGHILSNRVKQRLAGWWILSDIELRVVSVSGENRRQYLLRSLGGL